MCVAVEVVGQIMGKYISWGEGMKEKSAANANQKDKVEEVRTRCLSQYQPLQSYTTPIQQQEDDGKKGQEV